MIPLLKWLLRKVYTLIAYPLFFLIGLFYIPIAYVLVALRYLFIPIILFGLTFQFLLVPYFEQKHEEHREILKQFHIEREEMKAEFLEEGESY